MKGYGLHQDWIAWDGFPRTFLTVLVPFETVHQAGISVRDRVAGPEEDFTVRELIERVVDWPDEQVFALDHRPEQGQTPVPRKDGGYDNDSTG